MHSTGFPLFGTFSVTVLYFQETLVPPEEQLREAHTVYVDDSGTDTKASIVAAAFCVSTVEKWKEFEHKWDKIRQHAGFDQFHMTEFAACRRDKWCMQCQAGKTTGAEHPWRNWTPGKRENVLNRLAKTITKFTDCGFGMAHTKAEYDEHVRNSPARKFAKEPIGDQQFTFALQRCGGELARWRAANKITAPLKFVFDLTSHKQKEEITNVFFAAATDREQYQDGIEQWFSPVGVSYESRKTTLQLLSADMLAWTTAVIRSRQIFLRGEYEDAFRVARIFLGTNHLRIGYMEKQALQQWEQDHLWGEGRTEEATDSAETETPPL